ncbi:hypothetical protein [Roseiarcus sp.]|uniref:hypothetical protein n=1 Tax=Roseiarcus sp. TaxID=1969460 RepID=UPI003F94387C
MDEKPERPAGGQPDLGAALRRARIENAERADAVAEIREIELGRLALLQSALQPVVRQAPPGVDLFDLSLARGDRPRVFLDMVAFVEMARDRRTYRFFQDTLYGRVLIAESPKIDTIVAACTNYVARRLVERERALATADLRHEAPKPAEVPRRVESPGGEAEEDPEAPLHEPLQGAALASAAWAAERAPASGAPSASLARWLVGALSFLLMTLGAITLIGLVALAGYLAWTHQLGAFLSRVFGAAPP